MASWTREGVQGCDSAAAQTLQRLRRAANPNPTPPPLPRIKSAFRLVEPFAREFEPTFFGAAPAPGRPPEPLPNIGPEFARFRQRTALLQRDGEKITRLFADV